MTSGAMVGAASAAFFMGLAMGACLTLLCELLVIVAIALVGRRRERRAYDQHQTRASAREGSAGRGSRQAPPAPPE